MKKQQQTMNRSRRVQFIWRKFCRLIKYYKCLEASRLIKGLVKKRVMLILRQWRVFSFRRSFKKRILNKKAKFIQSFLRKVIAKRRHEYYMANVDKVVMLQSCFRMIKAQRTAFKLRKVRMQMNKQAEKFENVFVMLYNKKPGQKRKQKINKLLTDQQSVLLRERIFIGAGIPASTPQHRKTGSGYQRPPTNAPQGILDYGALQ